MRENSKPGENSDRLTTSFQKKCEGNTLSSKKALEPPNYAHPPVVVYKWRRSHLSPSKAAEGLWTDESRTREESGANGGGGRAEFPNPFLENARCISITPVADFDTHQQATEAIKQIEKCGSCAKIGFGPSRKKIDIGIS